MRKKELYEKRMFWLKAFLIICLFIVIQFLYVKVSPYFSIIFYDKSHDSTINQYQLDGIVFSYPINWDLSLTPYGNHGDMDVIAILNVPFQSLPDITVAKREFDSNDIYQIAEWASSRVSENREYTSMPLAEFKSNDLLGLTRRYTYRIETPFQIYTIRCKDVYLNQNEIGYVFSFCSDINEWDEYEFVFEKIIDSIKFID